MKLAVDANIIIYSVEGAALLQVRLAETIGAISRDTEFIASQLLRLECRVQPMQRQNQRLLDEYDRALRRVQLQQVTDTVIETATQMRAFVQ